MIIEQKVIRKTNLNIDLDLDIGAKIYSQMNIEGLYGSILGFLVYENI